MHCPLECEYLQEARKRDEPPVRNPDDFPNKDIRVSENFLRANEHLMIFLSMHLLDAALGTPNIVDSDLKDALDALIRTYRTLNSGLYYESRPANVLAAAVVNHIQAKVEELRKASAQDSKISTIRDLDILGVLVFLQRMEIQQNNGRRLGRAFIDFLRANFPETEKPADAPHLIV